jgi:hypothetical protein
MATSAYTTMPYMSYDALKPLSTIDPIQLLPNGGQEYQKIATPTGPTAAEQQAQADEQAYWSDQLTGLDQQIGRLGGQKSIGYGNIDNSYQSAFNKLLNDKNQAQGQYDTKRNQTIQDNVETRSGINMDVGRRLKGLQQLFGNRGGGNSSWSTLLAPFASAQVGNQQLGQVQKTYGRNLSALDQGWDNTNRQFDSSFGSLASDRDQRRRDLEGGFAQTEAGLQEQKAQAEVQKRQAAGAGYKDASAMRVPYQNRINQLLGIIDQSSQQKAFTPNVVDYQAPNLEQYNYNRYTPETAGSTVGQSALNAVGPFWNLLKDKKQQLGI